MSRLSFDPELGLIAPDTKEIRDLLAEAWKAAFRTEGLPELDTEPSSPAGQLLDAQVAEVEAKIAEVLFMANQLNPKVAEGMWQDALGHLYFMPRKAAEPTVAVCSLGGLPGTVVDYGSLVEDGEGRRYVCSKTVAIGEDGTAETTFRCAAYGPIEAGPNSITKIVTAIAGWDSVTNPEAGAAGRLVESRFDFEARRKESVAKNAHGSAASLYGSLHDLSGAAGVIDVQVLENIGPDPVIRHGVEVPGHGVTICIFGGQDEDIAKIIYERKDAGCDTGGNTTVSHRADDLGGALYQYKILRPDLANFRVKVTLGGSEALTPALAASVKRAVVDDFNGASPETGNPRIGLASTVYSSRFYRAVLEAGVRNLYEIKIALGDDSPLGPVAEIRGDQEPVISPDNVDVEVQS